VPCLTAQPKANARNFLMAAPSGSKIFPAEMSGKQHYPDRPYSLLII